MAIIDALPMDEFLSKFKNSHTCEHKINVAYKLAKNYRQLNGSYISDVDLFIESLKRLGENKAAIYDRIAYNWSAEIIRKAERETREGYNEGKRYYKRGRPFGAKNKPKPQNDSEAIDVLRDLGLEDNQSEATPEMTDDELLRELMEEPKAPKKPEIKETKVSLMDSVVIREMIAAQMQDFIKAYGRDKDEMQNGLKGEIDRLNKELDKHFADTIKDIEDRFNNLKPNIIELKRLDMPSINLGVQHKNFEKLLKVCSATLRNGSHNNVWIYGPAGTGKSTAAEKVAEALNLDYYTDGKMADETKVTGYKDANGTYHSTNFRKAFEFGGVYLADEIDGSMPDALLALNGALANGHCSFPDRIVARHKDFIFIAAANTTGTGGTIEYVGRFKQDAAFNDRFVFLDWPLDEALEDSLVANKEWLAIVRRVRGNIARSTIKGHLITPRASIYGESLLAAGLDLEFVINSVLKKGLTEAQWNMVK